MEQEQTPRHAVIYYDVLRKLKINVEEYIILDMVYYLEHRTGYCYKSAASMAEDLSMEKRAIQYIIQKLIKRGLLERLNDHAIRLTDIYINTAVLYKKSVGDTKNLYPLRMPATTPVRATNDLYTPTNDLQGGYKKMSKKQGTRYTYRNTIKNNNLDKSKLAKADEYGKPEINDLFSYWQQEVGYPIENRVKQNRNAASNLLKRYGSDKLCQLIRGVAAAQLDQYAPRVADFADLQAKTSQLIAWGKTKHTTESEVRVWRPKS